MTSVHRLLSSFCAAVLLVFAAAAPAQDIRRVHPEKFERATKTDDAGLVQWAEHVEIKCGTCSGTGKMKCPTCERHLEGVETCIECKKTKETACQACGGVGHFVDPLEKVLCPGCMGAAVQVCECCNGGGTFKTEDSGDRFVKCPACRAEGGWACKVCDGARLVDAVPLKPSLAEADAAALQKAIDSADAQLALLEKFTPVGGPKARKAAKQLEKDLQKEQKTFPVLKKLVAFFEDCMGKVYGGRSYQGQEDREASCQHRFREGAKYYLQHQRRMMELAKKRQEANEKVAEANKEK